MASGLFGSGPQSNILNTVQSSYNAMLNAERQKGVAMSTAMGAFGQAISPKAIGMRKFKEKFADADWSKPETYFSASKFINEFDPTAAISMADKGMALAAQLAPKAPVWQEIKKDNADGSSTISYLDMNNYTGESFESVSNKPVVNATATIDDKVVQGTRQGTTFTPFTQDTGKAIDPPKIQSRKALVDGKEVHQDFINGAWTTTGDVKPTDSSTPSATGAGMYDIKGLGERQGFRRGGISYYIDKKGEEQLQPEGSRFITDVIKTEEIRSPENKWVDLTVESKNDTQNNPIFKQSFDMYVSTNKAEAALATGKPASVQAAVQQIASSFDDKGRAYASTLAIQNSGSIGANLADWASKKFEGTPAPAKLEEYKVLVGILKDLSTENMISTIKSQSSFFADTLPKGYTPKGLTSKLLSLLPAGVKSKVLSDGGVVYQDSNGNWIPVL